MKATGITRRIDDLGRIVIPKEIRRTMRIREGDPLEIYTDREGSIVLKKYSPIGELGEVSKEFVEAVASVAKCTVCVADRDIIVAAAGNGKKDYLGRHLHPELEECIERRENILATKEDARFCKVLMEEDETYSEAVATVISEGDAIGAVLMLARSETETLGELEKKLASCGANFLGRQMEQ